MRSNARKQDGGAGRNDEITASNDVGEGGEEQGVSGGDGRNIEVDKEGGILKRLDKTCDKNINADEAGSTN